MVKPVRPAASSASRITSSAGTRVVGSVAAIRLSRAIRKSGNVTLMARKNPPAMYSQTSRTPYLRASITMRIATDKPNIRTSAVMFRDEALTRASCQKLSKKAMTPSWV